MENPVTDKKEEMWKRQVSDKDFDLWELLTQVRDNGTVW